MNTFPNPFNSQTTIQFSLSEKSIVDIIIYDYLGKKVKTFERKEFEIGLHELKWNAENIASGIYFVNMNTKNKRIIVIIIRLVWMTKNNDYRV